MVAPFLVPLKKWVVQQKKKDTHANSHSLRAHIALEEPLTEDDIGTQTEPVRDQSLSTPAIEALEGATRELHRLLNIQPQPEAVPFVSDHSNEDKGASLMAILQRKNQGSSHSQSHQPGVPNQHQVPHTPLDLVYTNPPQPHTPHHHYPVQMLPNPNDQAPPPFLVAHASSGQFAAHQTLRNSQGPYYNQAGIPAVQGNRNPNYATYNQNIYMPAGNQQHRQPVLLHPQPLPPQVQQSLPHSRYPTDA